MKNLFEETNKILESNCSFFESMDKIIALYEAANEDEGMEDTEGDEGADAPTEGTDEQAPVDATEPMPGEDEPADDESGIYVSSNEKAVIAKTMLDALMATPPKTGEIPQELLNVTDGNADQVIKFIQSLIGLSSTLDTSITSDNNEGTLASELKDIR